MKWEGIEGINRSILLEVVISSLGAKKLEDNDSKNDKHTSFGYICKYIRKHDPEEVSLKSKSKQGIPENEAIQT